MKGIPAPSPPHIRWNIRGFYPLAWPELTSVCGAFHFTCVSTAANEKFQIHVDLSYFDSWKPQVKIPRLSYYYYNNNNNFFYYYYNPVCDQVSTECQCNFQQERLLSFFWWNKARCRELAREDVPYSMNVKAIKSIISRKQMIRMKHGVPAATH